MDWIKKSFRRHLLDMHINDWDEIDFLSEFSPEEYYNNLKKANVKSAMIYLQSHLGYCYYPTKIGHIHSAFKERPDCMRKLIDLCHEGGIDVVAYYSINYNTLESHIHSDWHVVERIDGQKQDFSGERYGICCPNNPEYFDFILEQTKEILDYAPFEGIFFDMPFWNSPCYCEYCTAKYKAAADKNIPLSREESDWPLFLKEREKWTDDYIGRLTHFVKSINPNITVEYNYAYAGLDAVEIIGSEVINKYNDYASGDIYRDYYTQDFACRLYSAVSKNKPFEYMTGRCDPNLGVHTVTKSDDKLRLAIMSTVAHHGANFIIDAIDPIGTMNGKFYDKLGHLFSEVEKYEPYMSVGEPVEEIGLFYILEARGINDGNPFNHYNSTLNTAKILNSNHIQYGIVTQATLKERINKFKAVIISNPANLTDESIKILDEYVTEGGVVYFSGFNDGKLTEKFLNTKTSEYADFPCTYMYPQNDFEDIFEDFSVKYPLSFPNGMPLVPDIENCEVVARVALPYIHSKDRNLFSSIHSNPPGTYTENPAVIVKEYGKGKVIWSAVNIESQIALCYQKILFSLLRYAGVKDFRVETTADTETEIIAFESDTEVLISVVYGTTAEKTSLRPPFEIKIKCGKPKKIILLSDNSEIPFSYEDGKVVFKTKELNIFDMYDIKF